MQKSSLIFEVATIFTSKRVELQRHVIQDLITICFNIRKKSWKLRWIRGMFLERNDVLFCVGINYVLKADNHSSNKVSENWLSTFSNFHDFFMICFAMVFIFYHALVCYETEGEDCQVTMSGGNYFMYCWHACKKMIFF